MAKTNGNGNGSSIKLEHEDALMVSNAFEAVKQASMRLGDLRAQYIAAEAQAIQAWSKAQGDMRNSVDLVAKHRGIDTASQEWAFDLENLTFRKKGPVAVTA
jgi:hypothetical protein